MTASTGGQAVANPQLMAPDGKVPPMNRSIRRTLASAGVAAVMLGGAAACGDDNGVDTPDAEDTPGVEEDNGGGNGGGDDGGEGAGGDDGGY